MIPLCIRDGVTLPRYTAIDQVKAYQTAADTPGFFFQQCLRVDEGFGEFGLDVTNPIPVQGIISNEVYLKKLVTIDGSEIHWEREGSTKTENIKNAIDIYKIFDSGGRLITKLFISPYHKRISNKIPKGFMLKN